jgi:hypothetical protein
VVESESLGNQLKPGQPLSTEKEKAESESAGHPRERALKSGVAEAQPLFEDVDFAEDVSTGDFDGETAQEQDGGIEKKYGRKQDGVPVADLFVGAGIHVGAGLTREEERDEDGKKHHVGGEDGEDGETNFVQKFARATALVLAVVITAATAAASRAPV